MGLLKKDKVYIYGAGGLGKELAAIIEYSKKSDLSIVFIDDALDSTTVKKYEVIRSSDWLNKDHTNHEVFIGIANVNVRKRLFKNLTDLQVTWSNYLDVDTTLYNKESIEIGIGNIIFPKTYLTTDIKIGDNNIFHFGCHIGHDTRVGNHCILMPRVMITSGAEIEDSVTIGVGSIIGRNVKISSGTTIPPNSCVLNSI